MNYLFDLNEWQPLTFIRIAGKAHKKSPQIALLFGGFSVYAVFMRNVEWKFHSIAAKSN